MKIVCLVKFVPKVDDFKYDYEQNILIRDNVPMILNPDDACALSYALQLKDKNPETTVEVVSMGPLGLKEKMEDLLRRNVDRATLLSDKKFVGSDSFATSHVLSTYLKSRNYDLILSGSQTLDGDTGHIGPQVAELLDIPQCSNIVKINDINSETATFTIDDEDKLITFEMSLPCLLSVSKDSKYKLKFVKSSDMHKDVEEKFFVLTNEDLQLPADKIGLKGSPTKVSKSFVKKLEKRKTEFIKCDDAGIEKIYKFLQSQGVV